MRSTAIRTVVWSLVICLALVAPLSAKRKKRRPKKHTKALTSLRLQHIDLELGGVPLGKDKAAVFAYLSGLFDARMKKQMRATLDAELRDQYRQQRQAALKKLKKSYTEFTGSTTGYEVTSVGQEFKHRTGESVYRFDDGRIQKYYFLIKGRFWKVVWVHNEDTTYAKTASQLRKAFGSPSQSSGTVTSWNGRNATVTLRDERKGFGSYTIVIAHRPTLLTIAQLRKGGTVTVGTNPNVSDTVKKLSSQKKNTEVDNVVDRITGKKQKIDINLGKKKKEPKLEKDEE